MNSKKQLLVLTCVVFLACASSAIAKTPVSVSIKLGSDHSKVSGHVRSNKGACERGRKVKLFYAFSTSDTFTQVDSDISSSKGKWSIPGPDGSDIPDGRLYATVPTKQGCAKAKSKTIRSDKDGVPFAGW